MRCFGSSESGINKSAQQCPREAAEGVAGPVPDVRAAAIRSVELMVFVRRAVNRQTKDADEDRPPHRPSSGPLQCTEEGRRARKEGNEVRQLIVQLEDVHLLDLLARPGRKPEDRRSPKHHSKPCQTMK